MPKYRDNLPQLNGRKYITDGGLETTLIFHEGLELPEFAAFDLLKNESGQELLYKYFVAYAQIARENHVGFVLEGPTWRASTSWGEKLGYSSADLVTVNQQAINLLEEVRAEYESESTPIVISGCIGSRDDGYNPVAMMSVGEAESYHSAQIETFKNTNVDFVSALTMSYIDEAIGIVCAAQSAGLPVVISFTVETDGRLPSGVTLKEAVESVDQATESAPVYYMINCAHPTHFAGELVSGEDWVSRIRGIRANASDKSHAELDEAEELDDGNPVELGGQYKNLIDSCDHINVFGGCCGTDLRHIDAICKKVIL